MDRALQYDSHWSLLSGYNPLQQTDWKACACAAVDVLVQVVSCLVTGMILALGAPWLPHPSMARYSLLVNASLQETTNKSASLYERKKEYHIKTIWWIQSTWEADQFNLHILLWLTVVLFGVPEKNVCVKIRHFEISLFFVWKFCPTFLNVSSDLTKPLYTDTIVKASTLGPPDPK